MPQYSHPHWFSFMGTHHRELAMPFGPRNLFEQIAPFQHPHVEEAQRSHILLDRAPLQLLPLKQVGLILTQVVRTELVGWLLEMVGEFLYHLNVGFYGTLSVIMALEFLQHHFA